MFLQRRTTKQGFTLIELMVVIAIIGILLTISLAGIGNARVKGRDARRIADLRTIQSALEMHAFNNQSRSYPPSTAEDAATANYCPEASGDYGIYDNDCLKPYLANTPADPAGTPYTYVRPACLTVGANPGESQMEKIARTSCGSSRIFTSGYGLHITLEDDNNEARNDASPTDPKSYDLMQ